MIAEKWNPAFVDDHAQNESGVTMNALQQGVQ